MYLTDRTKAIALNNGEKAISFLRIVSEDFPKVSRDERKEKKNRHYTAKFSNYSKCLLMKQ